MSKNKNHTRREKAKIIIISLIAAIITWAAIMWVDNPDITTTVSGLEVRFVGESDLRERGFVITGKKNIPEMSAVIRGKRSDLMDYMDDICIEVDASSINEAGEYMLPGTVFMPTSRLIIEKEKHGDIPIAVEKLETKEIEVRIKQIGTVKEKFIESVIEHPKVVISGAKSELDQVAYGMATVDISKINYDCIEPVNYVLMDENDGLIGKNETIATKTAVVDVKNTIYNIKNLPVTVQLSEEMDKKYGLDQEKSSVTPARIDVGVLDYNTDTDIKAVINNVKEDGSVEYSLVPSEGMYIPEESMAVKVKAELKKKTSKKLELEVQVENPPSGTVSIEPVSVVVWGEESDLNTDNVKAYVDLKGLEHGTHSLPVKISGDGISVKDSYSVDVTIE